MTLKLYMDHHVPLAITEALRARGVDVLTAYEDGAAQFSDELLLTRATELERVLFTQDADLLSEADLRLQRQETFYGIVFGQQNKKAIGAYIQQLEIIAKAGEAGDMINHVDFLKHAI